MSAHGVLRIIEGEQLGFWCPGCKELHVVGPGWKFNGNYERPTFAPSILIQSGHYLPTHKKGEPCWCTYNAAHPDKPPVFTCDCCHSFVRDGQIQFLNDCTHKLAGKIVALALPAHFQDPQ